MKFSIDIAVLKLSTTAHLKQVVHNNCNCRSSLTTQLIHTTLVNKRRTATHKALI